MMKWSNIIPDVKSSIGIATVNKKHLLELANPSEKVDFTGITSKNKYFQIIEEASETFSIT